MEQKILETLAAEAMKHIDMATFAEQLAPKLMKELERGIMKAAKEMYWDDLLSDAIATDELQRELSKRIIAAVKNGA